MSGTLGDSLSRRGPKKTPEGSAGRWDEEVGRPLGFEGATPSSVYDFKGILEKVSGCKSKRRKPLGGETGWSRSPRCREGGAPRAGGNDT